MQLASKARARYCNFFYWLADGKDVPVDGQVELVAPEQEVQLEHEDEEVEVQLDWGQILNVGVKLSVIRNNSC